MEFIKGQKTKLEQLVSNMKITIKSDMNFIKDNIDLDMCCFGVDKDEKLSDDRYFIFYNQLTSPEESIKKFQDRNIFEIDIKLIPSTIKKIVLCATIDGQGTVKDVKNGSLRLMDGEREVGQFKIEGKDYTSEKSIILAEIYERDGIWRLGIVASGFNGGLGDILRNYGGEEIEESELTNLDESVHTKQEDLGKNIYLEKKDRVQKLVLEKAPHLIDLTKKVTITLEKKHMEQTTASVVVILDNSGSMDWQYRNGDIQRTMDKLLPVALMFDDNGELDTWAFASKTKHLSPITLDNIKNYLNEESKGWKKWHIGWGNDEPKVMSELINQYMYNHLPVYVIFLSDGGIYETRKIKKLLIESSNYPIFWQFMGVGGSNYGILEELDEMEGRIVDNANFFSIDNINSLSDEALYEKLLNEFPIWLKEASSKGIIKK
ncbi:general stress protein 16U [Clostridium saccharobutylicum]|uniref:VWA domain-containing protein n=1 Tax=Clostridium saccharobutylicum TaxID=169679 RepID=UPI000983D934|nr:VWA domain-containing protein [Clostridium saccharobutylicum]AQS08579.1 general stress protein 16U [Clostridium saccharobutylicum]MBC2436051.1 tellurium resistance protein [Clostridium saccharobutylicum]NSB87825.1 stress response protein SCP2 [Clostridium saccharobutylicum]NYC29081.1 stress response protein SCP2 [Clostridium saccharobutylicum]OOM13282.1 general stress protein 16U [Clostridium saccharobutylicum]